MLERRATYDGTVPPVKKDEKECEGDCGCKKRRQQRVLRRFVTRGGELVEVTPVPVRETR